MAWSTRHGAGFTLTEVLVSLTLATILLTATLSSFLMIGRSGINAANYSVSEAQVRRGIEEFSQDLRMARAIRWNSGTSITLTVPDNYASTSNEVTYAYDPATVGATAQTFYRKPGNAASTAAVTVYVRGVTSFSFTRFNRLNSAALTDAETKRVQLTMNVRRTGSTLVAANTTLVSASYTLRNKASN